ncbi:MAG: nuclear transport factor 2 family protein [Pseudomonadota bacterium]
MAISLEEVLETYAAAWCAPNADTRNGLLAACWSNVGKYRDPSSQADGRSALSDLIGGFHQRMPGSRVVLTSGAATHNDRIYFTWQMVSANGDVMIDGVDFGKLGPDGRLVEIIGFFGPPPPA